MIIELVHAGRDGDGGGGGRDQLPDFDFCYIPLGRDVLCTRRELKLVKGDFLDVFPRDGEFDAVVTLFFIDISVNVVDFLSNIHRLLKPGGVWINLGRTFLSLPSSSTNTNLLVIRSPPNSG